MGKIVVVTGAAVGIGRAIAKKASSEGHTVIAVDINEPVESVDIITASGGNAAAYSCDLRNENAVKALFEWVGKKYGVIDVLINNAGTMGRWPLSITETTVDDWDKIIDTNLKSVFLCCRQVLPEMRKSGSGAIVNIGSELAFIGGEGATVYAASKAAIVNFTRSLAVEEAKHGVRVNVVCPGPIDTGMLRPTLGITDEEMKEELAIASATTALKRLGKPQEIAEVVWFAASDAASFMVGSVLLADGGVLAG